MDWEEIEESEEEKGVRPKAYFSAGLLLIAAIVGGIVLYEPEPEQRGPLLSQMPMVIFKDKTAQYQVVTYDDKAVTSLVIQLKPKFHQAFHNVYLNFRSQFVYNDGRPILYREEPIFWNREGDVVNYDYQVIHEANIFYVDEGAIKKGTALTLRELKDIAKAKYHKSLRDNVRMESLRVFKDES